MNSMQYLTSAVVTSSVVARIHWLDSVLSVAGASTSSFGLVGTTVFWISEEDSAMSCVSVSCVRDLLLRYEQMLTAPIEVRVVALDSSY
ncbi:Multidrug/pheromone exporter, ABC superfamily (ISS) [Dorcoceras hygrometricum]|uniref:Multidrug/pheromone exporter, ABC superfamily (ISS) n=1 Tax=Dorcoceras hygrometricum TaxID=472368 RepID=A0A2Z7AHV8_9LAMI|nr:Multidrug/pheromone exporter, ABC superfamily (ISS) [Dorcoceras hygrometricum]